MRQKSNNFEVFIEKVYCFMKVVYNESFYVLGGAFLAVFSILWTTACLPIYLFRFSLKYAAKKWRPDLGEMLSVSSTLLAVDDMYGKPTAGIVVYIELDGQITEDFMKDHIEKKLNAQNSQGQVCYPEAKQYITKWLGFYFFKQVDNFDIRNYYTFYHGNKNEEFLEKDLGQFVSDWLAKPFPKYQSPWSYYVIHNFRSSYDTSEKKSNKSLLLLRSHHALADGFSIHHFLTNNLDAPAKLIEPSGSLSKLGSRRLLSQMFTLPIVTPYRLFKLFYDGTDRNEWHQSEYSNEVCYTLLPRIPVTRLKEVREMYGVSSISVVILAGLAGTVRRAMVSQGVTVPDMVHAVMPFLIPGHPKEKLVNHAGLTLIGLPVGICDPVKRLESINEIIDKAIKDPTPLILYRISCILSGVFDWLVRPICGNYYSTVNASCLPGAKELLRVKGFSVTDIGYFIGTMMGNPGIMFNIITYNGNLRLSFGFNKELQSTLSNPCLDDYAAGFEKEIDILLSLNTVGKKSKVL